MAGTEGGRPSRPRPELSTVKMSRLGVLQCFTSLSLTASPPPLTVSYFLSALSVSPELAGLPHLSMDFLSDNTELSWLGRHRLIMTELELTSRWPD